ncbi:hypothetical protein Leryth_024861 [Lithospermum erythrorhizon]|nr:hypothetical protein Leryth_024861 [Lithospermum erythrorhizon]
MKKEKKKQSTYVTPSALYMHLISCLICASDSDAGKWVSLFCYNVASRANTKNVRVDFKLNNYVEHQRNPKCRGEICINLYFIYIS